VWLGNNRRDQRWIFTTVDGSDVIVMGWIQGSAFPLDQDRLEEFPKFWRNLYSAWFIEAMDTWDMSTFALPMMEKV
jgi:hypothetical protein